VTDQPSGPLAGVRVLELATVIAGPGIGRYLADFGADVIKIEAPAGDSTRRMGWTAADDDDSYFWKLLSRNKRCTTLDLRTDAGRSELLRLARRADVLIENMRPGKLDALDLGAEVLHDIRPSLVIVRVSGPYAQRPGFATLAEALSGFSALSGQADGPPLLPPIALTDEITALAGAFATMLALRHAEHTGIGQEVDVNLLESIFQTMGPLVSAFAHLGYLQPRLGSGIPYSVPRGTYLCRDGRWVAISSSADSVARRVLALIGHEDDSRFVTFADRLEHRDELEEIMAAWVSDRDREDVLREFERTDAAVAPVLDMAGVFDDPHFAARDSIVEVDGVQMQGLIAHLSQSPGSIRHAGMSRGVEDVDWLVDG